MCDFNINKIVKKSKSLKDVQIHYKPIIEIIRKILKKEKPDVVLVNGTYYLPWIIAQAAKAEKIPVVLWYAGVLSREVVQMTPKFRKMFMDMEKSMITMSSRIFFPSTICRDVVYKEVSKSTSVKNGDIISNPIAPIFTRSKKIEQSVQNRIAFVGRNALIKNLDEFCLIHKKLLKMGWKHEATIVSDVNKKDLKKIPKTIRVISSMSPKNIKVFYATQGLIISPSHFETFGNVPVEAACIGIPVLVNKTMGCSDVLIESGLERMVIDFDDKDGVLERVKELCGESVLPRQINNLRKRVDTEYVANKMISVIQKVGGFARATVIRKKQKEE
jgi:glycosyltransferase involved in cell wall biosynthesis